MKWLVHNSQHFVVPVVLLAIGYAVFCCKYIQRLGDMERKLAILIGIVMLIVTIVLIASL